MDTAEESYFHLNEVVHQQETVEERSSQYVSYLDLDSKQLVTIQHIFEDQSVDSRRINPAQEEVQTESLMPLYDSFMFDYEADVLPAFNDANTIYTKARTTNNQKSVEHGLSHMTAKPKQRSCDDQNMVVQTSDHSKKEKRLFCLYCKKSYTKLARHLEHVHNDEFEVRQLTNLPKGSKRRQEILAGLRKKGTFEFNTNSKFNNGVLIASRRPNIKHAKKATDFTTCANCLGTYAIGSIRHHVKKCTNNTFSGERSVLVLGRMVEARIHERAGDQLMKIFSVLKEDHIVRLIRYDWLLILYGNKLCVKYTAHYQHDLIRSKLRLAGKLLNDLKTIRPEVSDFASIYQPKLYDSLIEAVRIVGKFDSLSNSFGSPSTAAAAVTQIRDIGGMLVAEYIKQENFESQTKTENFLKLYNTDVGTTINKAVFDTQAKMRREKRERLPTTEDIKLLATYLDRERKHCFVHLKQKFSYSNWLKLSELTMACIIVFNRRRTGETQNILVTDFNRREYIDDQTTSTLSDKDKDIAKTYSRMKVRGKKGRTVPVLIKPGVDKCIELIIRHRDDAKVSTENEFLFGLPCNGQRIKVIDAPNLLRKFSVLCGAKDPESLRGTKIRKHMASSCILMELTDNSISEVADFMGHHEKIHREYYRQNPIVREVVKMSKLLKAAQGFNDNEESEDDEDVFNQEIHNVTDFGSPNVEINDVDGPDVEGVINASTNVIDELRRTEGGQNKKTEKKRWSAEEIAAAYKAFDSYFKQRKLPSLEIILRKQRLHEALKHRTPKKIKSWICNQLKKKIT